MSFYLKGVPVHDLYDLSSNFVLAWWYGWIDTHAMNNFCALRARNYFACFTDVLQRNRSEIGNGVYCASATRSYCCMYALLFMLMCTQAVTV